MGMGHIAPVINKVRLFQKRFMCTKVATYVAILRMGSDFVHRHTCNSTCQSKNISKRNNVGVLTSTPSIPPRNSDFCYRTST
jgi:hypothetical protein